MKLLALPAFQDNYLWLLHDGERALVVDPGDAQPVLAALSQHALRLEAILVTHHHPDHVGGVDAVRDATGATVYGPAHERIPGPCVKLSEGDTVDALGATFRVIDVPGHTAGHIAYYSEFATDEPLLFCGDTLFSGGCGRLFEGTPAQMLGSLKKLSSLPGSTRVCCTHEYTLANLKFARVVEPGNEMLGDYAMRCEEKRARGEPTLPSTIAQERRINPFLRTREAAVAQAAHAFNGAAASDEVAVFAALRQWKNEFR